MLNDANGNEYLLEAARHMVSQVCLIFARQSISNQTRSYYHDVMARRWIRPSAAAERELVAAVGEYHQAVDEANILCEKPTRMYRRACEVWVMMTTYYVKGIRISRTKSVQIDQIIIN